MCLMGGGMQWWSENCKGGQNRRPILVGLSKLFHVITEFCRFNCFSFVNCSYRYQIAVGPMCVTML